MTRRRVAPGALWQEAGQPSRLALDSAALDRTIRPHSAATWGYLCQAAQRLKVIRITKNHKLEKVNSDSTVLA